MNKCFIEYLRLALNLSLETYTGSLCSCFHTQSINVYQTQIQCSISCLFGTRGIRKAVHVGFLWQFNLIMVVFIISCMLPVLFFLIQQRVEKGSVLLFRMILWDAATPERPATPANSPNSQVGAHQVSDLRFMTCTDMEGRQSFRYNVQQLSSLAC